MTTPHMALARKHSESTKMTCFIRGVLINAKIDPSALLDTNQQTATCAERPVTATTKTQTDAGRQEGKKRAKQRGNLRKT